MTKEELKAFQRFCRAMSKMQGEGMDQNSPWLRGYRQALRDAAKAAHFIHERGAISVDELEREIF